MRARMSMLPRRLLCSRPPRELLDFSDHSVAYRHKSLWELVRALGVLKACSYDALVDNSHWLLSTGERVLGRRLLAALVGPTLYRQFVGGATPSQMRACVARLGDAGVRTIVACSVEEDHHHQASPTSGESALDRRVSMYGRNSEAILSCLHMSSELNAEAPLMQLKMSGLLPPKLLVHLSHIFQSTGESERLVICLGDVLRSGCYQEYSDLELGRSDHEFLKLALKNLRNICETSKNTGVKILVDAEYADMNAGIELLGLALMNVFNEGKPNVWNTYQCYLKDTPAKVERQLALATRMGVSFAVKLVRGAYMDSERKKARESQCADAVCPNYAATNDNYDRVLCYLLEEVQRSHTPCSLVVATHNEDSIRTATRKMKQLGLPVNDYRISFAQLLGMYDHITFPMAAVGYNVYKSVPYGPLAELLSYLARRASENRAVLKSPVVERRMLAREIRRRLGLAAGFGTGPAVGAR